MSTLNRRDIVAAGVASALALSASARADARDPNEPAGMGRAKYVDVDGVRTRYFEAGRGRKIVLIHGGQWPAPTCAEGWAPLFNLLKRDFHVYAFDKLGMGFTDAPKTDADYSMDAVIRHAQGFLDAVRFGRGVVLGHSRGALPAARIAADRPEMASHLIVLDSNALASDDIKLSERPDPPPLDRLPTKQELHEAALKSVLFYKKDFATEAWAEAELRIISQPKMIAVDKKFRELRDKWVAANPDKVKANPLIGNNMGSVVWWLIDAKHETLDRVRAGKLKAPMAMIWGWNDPFAPYSLALSTMETFSRVVDRVELSMVNHASHMVHVDQPAEVARLIKSFVTT